MARQIRLSTVPRKKITLPDPRGASSRSLADENQALTTLKQNWSKYAASDKTLCIGMESTGGPASYVELLSCLEVNRDAREIQSADPLEADLNSSPSTATGMASAEPRHRRRR
jgi:hypothetical protein